MTSDKEPAANPLSEAAPDSLAELFSRDPLKLQDQDIGKIVSELRAERERWVVAEASGKRVYTNRQPAKPDLDLSDLEL